MDLFSWHLTALKFQSWQWEVWKRKLTLDECSFSWVLQAIYIHVDIFHYTVLSLKMNLVLCSQIFYKKCIDDDWPLCRTYIRKLAISDPNSRASYIYRVPLSPSIWMSNNSRLSNHQHLHVTVVPAGILQNRGRHRPRHGSLWRQLLWQYSDQTPGERVAADTHEELLAPPSVLGGKELVPTVTDKA